MPKTSLLTLLALVALPMLAVAEAAPPAAPQGPQMSSVTELPKGIYTLEKTHASLTWRVKHLGLSNYTARFTGLDATLEIDPASPTQAKLTATVDPRSLRTDYPATPEKDFDKTLAEGAEWFNAGKFPSITFKSTKVALSSNNTAKVTGDLSFLGVTKPLTLDVTFNGGMKQRPFAAEGVAALGFSATTTLRRSEWGMTTYIPMIGDEVEITIEAEFESPAQVAKPK